MRDLRPQIRHQDLKSFHRRSIKDMVKVLLLELLNVLKEAYSLGALTDSYERSDNSCSPKTI